MSLNLERGHLAVGKDSHRKQQIRYTTKLKNGRSWSLPFLFLSRLLVLAVFNPCSTQAKGVRDLSGMTPAQPPARPHLQTHGLKGNQLEARTFVEVFVWRII